MSLSRNVATNLEKRRIFNMGFILFMFFLVAVAVGAFLVSLVAAKAEKDAGTDRFEAGGPGILKGISRLVSLAAAVIAVVVLLSNIIFVVPTGHAGVGIFFGKVSQQTYSEGINFKNPLVYVENMSIQTQTFDMHGSHAGGETANESTTDGGGALEVLTKDGLKIILDITIPYFLNASDAPFVVRWFTARGYRDTLLRAPAREAIRTVAREYTFDELYASKREEAANKMLTRLRDLSQSLAHARQPENARHPVLTIENVLIRRLTPPQQVIEAIERKLQAQQEAERMVFVLQREEREAERKAIEARGIAEFQNTVAQGVTPSLLRWRAIEATRELAESQNAKIVIIGNAGSDGLPIMLPLQ